MIHTGSIEKRSVSFRVLSDDQIEEIRRTAFEVMSKVGFRIYHQGARKMLKQAELGLTTRLLKYRNTLLPNVSVQHPKAGRSTIGKVSGPWK